MFDELAVGERVELAKAKMVEVINHFVYLLAVSMMNLFKLTRRFLF